MPTQKQFHLKDFFDKNYYFCQFRQTYNCKQTKNTSSTDVYSLEMSVLLPFLTVHVYLSICLSVYLSICPSVYLPVLVQRFVPVQLS